MTPGHKTGKFWDRKAVPITDTNMKGGPKFIPENGTEVGGAFLLGTHKIFKRGQAPDEAKPWAPSMRPSRRGRARGLL